MKYTDIIWDFNGTLLDDIRAGINAVNDMLSRRGLATIDSVERYRELFCFPIIEYYAKLGFDFEKEDYYTVLAPEWVALYLENYKRSTLNDGAEHTLQALAGLGYTQTLLSATEIEMLKGQLRDLGRQRALPKCGDLITSMRAAKSARHVRGGKRIRMPRRCLWAIRFMIGRLQALWERIACCFAAGIRTAKRCPLAAVR